MELGVQGQGHLHQRHRRQVRQASDTTIHRCLPGLNEVPPCVHRIEECAYVGPNCDRAPGVAHFHSASMDRRLDRATTGGPEDYAWEGGVTVEVVD